MATSVSLKELSKAIHAYLPQPTLPLPESLLDTIAAYLRRHGKADDAASARLQDELANIFEKYVKGNSAVSGSWAGILRRLLPALKTPKRVLSWLDFFKGILDGTNLEKVAVDEAVAALTDLIDFLDEHPMKSGGNSDTNPVVDRLILVWMDRFYPEQVEGDTRHGYSEKVLRDILISFGKRRLKAFLTSLDGGFVTKARRLAALRFLCDFIQEQPPHLYEALETSLFGHLLTCLQHDTSTAIISSALTALMMLLPHMPSSLAPHLPRLFNIYARLLFWDREISKVSDGSPIGGNQPKGWEVCTYNPEMDDFAIAPLSNYFTVLYGLYPINFVEYIRKPQRYLRHAGMPDPEEIEVQPTEIRNRSERFRRCHLLHPNFYTLTVDSEKTDFGRWIKSEASELLVECMALCQIQTDHSHQSPGHESPPPTAGWVESPAREGPEEDASDSALLGGSFSPSRKPPPGPSRTGEVQATGHDGASRATKSLTHSQLQDLINSNRVIKSSLHHMLANRGVPSSDLAPQEADTSVISTSVIPALAELAPTTRPTERGTQIAHLQQRVLVLEIDLTFERYTKKQHMAHIGELRRKLMMEAASEAEMQDLIMTNRHLKLRCQEAKMAAAQVRKESEKSRAMAKKWDEDLTNKFRKLRDEFRRTTAELVIIRRELDESKGECEKLRKLVCDGEVRESQWKQSIQAAEIEKKEVRRMKAEVEELTKSERFYQARELEHKMAVSSVAMAEAEAEMARIRLAAQEHDARRAKDLLESEAKELRSQLASLREEGDHPGVSAKLAIEGALASSRAKQAEQQKQYDLLMRKYTALQSSVLDMRCQGVGEPTAKVQASSTWTAGAAGESLALFASPGITKARPHRSVSNVEATAYNVTPPLEPLAGTASSPDAGRVASTSQGAGGPSGTGPLASSPEDQRHFGSSLTSRIRKESRESSKEEGNSGKPKKEKKSGLRGIRGFV
ncbi:hamartin [Drechmeria coniospora]|uniref:Hamartin n=1 Tax=Drechmeria coniospora TaxID=98403 RepID=A0A151GR59_DRECN|nr:hamartin [Drechmeria coniospora]KYK59586.1 hamartin [Drechmeria coniospora]